MLADQLAAFLRASEGISRVLVAADEGEAVFSVRHGAAGLVLLDAGHPGVEPFALARRIRAVSPGARILFLAGDDRPGWVAAALESDAAGFLGPDARAEDLARAVESARAGKAYYSPAVARIVTDLHTGRIPSFTAREREVLALLCRSLTSKEIGRALGLAPKSVEAHRARMMRKAGVASAPGLVRYALEQGLCRS